MFCVEDEFYFLFHCPVYSDLRNNPLFWLSGVDVELKRLLVMGDL